MRNEDMEWSVTEGVCMTHGAEGLPTYGVRGVKSHGEVWEWTDVDVCRSRVELLVCRLQQAQPQVCHLEDIVRDFIEQQAVE